MRCLVHPLPIGNVLVLAIGPWTMLFHDPPPNGIGVCPTDLPTPSPGERCKLVRDALRLTLWRATGSTGAWLAPEVVARKRAVCGV